MNTYRVTAYNSKGQSLGRPVYLKARNDKRAESGGKELLRSFGVRGWMRTKASIYNPMDDPELRGFVEAV